MSECNLCPRNCRVDRVENFGYCKSSNEISIAKWGLHFWEEPVISGTKGSGTIFFTGCHLGCNFCQNHQISIGENKGRKFTPKELNEIFFKLQEKGAHNINLVTASHYIDKIAEAISINKPNIPIVLNCGGYEKTESLKLLEGLVDVYLPDFKYAESDLAKKLSSAEDYPNIALSAIKEMLRQQPENIVKNGIIEKGVIVRHLILPLHTQNSIKALDLLKENFPNVPISLMAQYTPVVESKFTELNRKITHRERNKVVDYMLSLGLDGFIQERKSATSDFIPDFNIENDFLED